MKSHESRHSTVKAAEVLTDALREYMRSGMGTPRTTELINPLLFELGELRQYLYKNLDIKTSRFDCSKPNYGSTPKEHGCLYDNCGACLDCLRVERSQ